MEESNPVIEPKIQMLNLMLQGQSWAKATQQLGYPLKHSRAYQLLKEARAKGQVIWHDNRHGHPAKFRAEVRDWLKQVCQAAPQTTGKVLQTQIRQKFKQEVSTVHINRLRLQLGLANTQACRKSKGRAKGAEGAQPITGTPSERVEPEPVWQEGAGSLLLLAAAQQTGLFTTLEQSLTSALHSNSHPTLKQQRLRHSREATRHRLLATLLFLPVAELKRPWDLRSYTGQLLAGLSERGEKAYSYRQVERFLAEAAQLGCDRPLSNGLANWTTGLWHADYLTKEAVASPTSEQLRVFYVDGHHKPVYSDKLVPRGLVGKFGKILGCRGLTSLHDSEGHPLLITTARGDHHLTLGLPQIVQQYEEALFPVENARASGTKLLLVKEVVADREIMSASFLAEQVGQGRTVTTLLDTNQYKGLASFQEVGIFVPLAYDRQGQVVREVAPAKFELTLPKSAGKGKTVTLSVALIRDHRRQLEVERPRLKINQIEKLTNTPGKALPLAYLEKAIATAKGAWWSDEEGWEAAPAPAPLSEAKLIPLVTTGLPTDPVALVELYQRRWPCQENVFKDWLLPVGLDTNHGYAKQVVGNSEVKNKQVKLEEQLGRLKERTEKTRVRMREASDLSSSYLKKARSQGEELQQASIHLQLELEKQKLSKREFNEQMAQQLAPLKVKYTRLETLYSHKHRLNNAEYRKLAAYCAKQSELLRDLEELKQREREMVELDDRKDQLMSVLKVALVNLVMWVRDRYFSAQYRHATWRHLLPFFKLGGRVSNQADRVEVELVGFNDRRMNRELAALCAALGKEELQLPNGQYLSFSLRDNPLATPLPISQAQVIKWELREAS